MKLNRRQALGHRLQAYGLTLLLVLSTLFAPGTVAVAAAAVPPDLAAGYRYVSTLPLVSSPIQAVYQPTTGEVVGLDNAGNLAIYPSSGGTTLAPLVRVPENDAGNFGPNLVSDPQTPAVYWINMQTDTIETLNVSAPSPAISVVAEDSHLPEYLTMGPTGQHLYVIDAGSTGSGDIGQLSLADPAAGWTTLSLPAPASAAAAVYQSANGPIAFIPTAYPLNGSSGGAILRAQFGANPQWLPPIPDNAGLPASLALSAKGTLIVVGQSFSTALSAVPNPLAATPRWLPPAMAPDALLSVPGSLAVGSPSDVSVLGINSANNPVWMVYSLTQGAWSLPALPTPQGPLSASARTVISPTSRPALDMLTPARAEPLALANILPAPLLEPPPGTAVQIPETSTGSLWLPDQGGAVALHPATGSLGTSVTDPDGPTGGAAVTPQAVLGLTNDNPPGISQDPGSAIGPPPGGATPVALAAGAPQGGYWALLSGYQGTTLWSTASNQTYALATNYRNVVASAYGPILAGSGHLDVWTSGTVLKDAAFAGPLTVSADGALAMASVGLNNDGLALVALHAQQSLGTVALPPPTLLPGASLGSLQGLAVSPHGSWLYALSGNALVRYRGPRLTLSASSLTPPIHGTVTLTASLVNSLDQPVAGQPITFSTDATVITNAAGNAAITLRVAAASPFTVSATAPAVVRSLVLDPVAASPTPAPPPAPKSPSPTPNAPQPAPAPSTNPEPWPGSDSAPQPSPAPQPTPHIRHHGPTWAIQFHHLQPGMPVKVLKHPRWTAPRPPGSTYLAFRVTAGSRLRYPEPYEIEVSALHGDTPRPYGLWYFSQPAYRWYPVLPDYDSHGTLFANLPFLTMLAITSKPDPTALTLVAPTAVSLSHHLANRLFPNRVHHAVVAQPTPLSNLRWAVRRALAGDRPLLLLPNHHPLNSILGPIALHDAIRLTLAESHPRLAQALDHRGFHVLRSVNRPSAGGPPTPPQTGPKLWFDRIWWTPARLALLRRLNPHLGPDCPLPELETQATLLRALGLPGWKHAFWLHRIAPVIGRRGMVMVTGSRIDDTVQLAKTLATTFRTPLLFVPQDHANRAMQAFHVTSPSPFRVTVGISARSSVPRPIARCWHRRCRIPAVIKRRLRK